MSFDYTLNLYLPASPPKHRTTPIILLEEPSQQAELHTPFIARNHRYDHQSYANSYQQQQQQPDSNILAGAGPVSWLLTSEEPALITPQQTAPAAAHIFPATTLPDAQLIQQQVAAVAAVAATSYKLPPLKEVIACDSDQHRLPDSAANSAAQPAPEGEHVLTAAAASSSSAAAALWPDTAKMPAAAVEMPAIAPLPAPAAALVPAPAYHLPSTPVQHPFMPHIQITPQNTGLPFNPLHFGQIYWQQQLSPAAAWTTLQQAHVLAAAQQQQQPLKLQQQHMTPSSSVAAAALPPGGWVSPTPAPAPAAAAAAISSPSPGYGLDTFTDYYKAIKVIPEAADLDPNVRLQLASKLPHVEVNSSKSGPADCLRCIVRRLNQVLGPRVQKAWISLGLNKRNSQGKISVQDCYSFIGKLLGPGTCPFFSSEENVKACIWKPELSRTLTSSSGTIYYLWPQHEELNAQGVVCYLARFLSWFSGRTLHPQWVRDCLYKDGQSVKHIFSDDSLKHLGAYPWEWGLVPGQLPLNPQVTSLADGASVRIRVSTSKAKPGEGVRDQRGRANKAAARLERKLEDDFANTTDD